MARRPRSTVSAPEPLRAILERAGENRFARAREAIPAALWREAVGARIAERALPLSLEDGTLVLRVPTSVWANELSLLADEVFARLKEWAPFLRSNARRSAGSPARSPSCARFPRRLPGSWRW